MTTITLAGREVTCYGELHIPGGGYAKEVLTTTPDDHLLVLESAPELRDCGISVVHQLTVDRPLTLRIPVVDDFFRPFLKCARKATLKYIPRRRKLLMALAAQLIANPVTFYSTHYIVPVELTSTIWKYFAVTAKKYVESLQQPLECYVALVELATLQFDITLYSTITTTDRPVVVYAGRAHIQRLLGYLKYANGYDS